MLISPKSHQRFWSPNMLVHNSTLPMLRNFKLDTLTLGSVRIAASTQNIDYSEHNEMFVILSKS